MDFELDLSSENMTSFLELEQEIKEATTSLPQQHPLRHPAGPEPGAHRGVGGVLHQDRGLRHRCHESDHAEQLNLSSSLVTPEGQKVIIIIAPSSPTESLTTTAASDSDPEWSLSPGPLSPAQQSLLSRKPEQGRTRKKYARSKPPSPPSAAPYPADKKERKKAQNRTAAFRYREKKKSEQDLAEEELEALADKNSQLQQKLLEMETEFKYLKKLMVEAGLGKYTLAVNY